MLRTKATKLKLLLLVVISLAGLAVAERAAVYIHRRHLVDEFGRPLALHPGNGTVNADPSAKVEDASRRKSLPEFQAVPAADVSELTPATPFAVTKSDWLRSQGDAACSRYSSLSQINCDNINSLEVAWTYHSKDGKANIQATPVIANGVLYMPTAGNDVVAVNGATGSEIWRFKPGGHPAQRGLVYWPGNGVLGARLFFTSGAYLFALDPRTGQPVGGFGRYGKVRSGGVVSPAIYQNVIVVANWNVILGYDIATGRQLWDFSVLGKPLPQGEDDTDRGGNCWGGMAMDTERGIVYASTGSPHPNFLGLDHPGDNKYANSVIALEAKTGRLLWSFQEIRHDIWDLDIPAPPNLVTVMHGGKRVDAVAQVTKIGNTLLLDRLTGKPLFPYRLRRSPVSTLPGEQTSPYQPVIDLPQPFARQVFTEADITNLSPEAHAFVARQVASANFGWFEPFEPGKPTVYFCVHGGAQWTGAAFDPVSGWLYVSASELPWIITVSRVRAGLARDPNHPTPGETVYQESCASCHGKNRKGMSMAPSLLGLGNRMLDDETIDIIKNGRNSMPPVDVPTDKRRQLLDFLFERDYLPETTAPDTNTKYTYVPNGYPKLLDDQGYPGCTPPWGTLNAIDLNTGKIAWKVPLGEYDALTKRGIAKTGTENFGGAIATAGGLVFCAGTRDRKIRAFQKDSGQELWSYTLPNGGYATPATYEVGGRQYVVIAATGGGKLGGPTSDAYVAFALPLKAN
jgi:quinoprotein glucose dehydrogenase